MGPATGGMTIALAAMLVRDSRRRGPRSILDSMVVVAAFAILTFTHTSSIVVIVIAAVLGAMLLGRERPTSERASE
jgi:chromate transport protein ChrA